MGWGMETLSIKEEMDWVEHGLEYMGRAWAGRQGKVMFMYFCLKGGRR